MLNETETYVVGENAFVNDVCKKADILWSWSQCIK